jgi:hypothetical protein
VPYPFAHPVAVLPLVRPMGRFAVPSALAIGSIVPDLWYFVPLVGRADSHSVTALLRFCLPAGLLAYALFHLVLKHPLIALLPHAVSRRLASFASPSLPAVPWHAVIVSLLVGAFTHIVWDALTRSNDHALHGHNWLQHASTALGSAVLAWWIWLKLRRAPLANPVSLSPLARACALGALTAATLVPAWWASAGSPWTSFDLAALRQLLRTAGIAGLEGLVAAATAYCLLWQLKVNLYLRKRIR